MTRSGMNIAIRTDASRDIGTGHVMRCLTLADELRGRGARVVFIARAHPGHLNDMIRERGFDVSALPAPTGTRAGVDGELGPGPSHRHWLGVSRERDAEQSIEALEGLRPDWLVVDHYGLEESWERRLRPHARGIMVIDDLADRRHNCDVLLDPGFSGGGSERYRGLVPAPCTRLLGPRFALLRPQFAEARKRLRPRDGRVRRLMIFFGGTDEGNLTGRALEGLEHPDLLSLEVDVVLGANNPHRASIVAQVSGRAGVCVHTQMEDIAALMAEADLALGAGGTTTWERLCLGLPSLVITAADNQKPSAGALHEVGYIVCLGSHSEVGAGDIAEAVLQTVKQPERNRALSREAMNLVPTDGAQRTADALTRGTGPDRWRLREAASGDCELYWEWANDPEVRRNAFRPEVIPWEQHRNWFQARLEDDDAVLLLAETDTGPVGQVRFEKEGEAYTVSYSLGRQFRRLGLGKALLEDAIDFFFRQRAGTLIGETLEGNAASARIFQDLGFAETAPEKPGSRRFRLDCRPDARACHGDR